MGINTRGVISTLKMGVDGDTVDLAKCAARYASVGSTDDHHDTYHSFSALAVSSFLNKSFNVLYKSIKQSKDCILSGLPLNSSHERYSWGV